MAPTNTTTAADEPTVFTTEERSEEGDEYSWYRGQVHIHTNHTDKTDAVKWYKQHGYNFAILTDLNYATPVEELKSVYDKPGEFIVVPGIETNTTHEGTIHDMMGYGGTPKAVQHSDSREVTIPSEPSPQTYERQAKLIAEAGGIPSLAHPNFTWAATAADISEIDPDVLQHFEMITTEPGMNDAGGGGHPSTTTMWDEVLATGRTLYAIAADDSHHFERFGPETRPVDGELDTQAPSLPGRTSIFVRARELTSEAVTDAVARGDFYSVKHELTLPIEFEDITVDEDGIRIELPTGSKDIGWTNDTHNPTRYRTSFIGVDESTADDTEGSQAEVLKRDDSAEPSYQFDGSEQYIRARIEGSDGAIAWTQPVFLDDE